jgi:prophage maintenance system killer protein
LTGNKRIGFACDRRVPGDQRLRVRAPEADAVVHVLAIAAGELDEAGCAAWLKKSSRKRTR